MPHVAYLYDVELPYRVPCFGVGIAIMVDLMSLDPNSSIERRGR